MPPPPPPPLSPQPLPAKTATATTTRNPQPQPQPATATATCNQQLSLPPSSLLEASHPLLSPAQTKEHPVQLSPPQPDPRAQARKKRKTDKLSTLVIREVRRSKRLNPLDDLPPPPPVHETEVSARLWFGPGPPPPRAKSRTRAETAKAAQPTLAETVAAQPTNAETAAAQSGTRAEPAADAQPTLSETAAAQPTDAATAAAQSETRAELAADAQPTWAEPAAAQPILAETADAQPTLSETAAAQPTDAATAAAQSETRAELAADAQPTWAEPAAAQPILAETADAQPTLSETAAAQSADAETAADQSGTRAETPTAHSPTRAETDAAQFGTQAETAAAQSGDSSPRPHTDWSSSTDWSPSRSETASEPQSGDSSPRPLDEGVYTDDGSIRCRNRRTLRSCPDAFQACGRELDASAAQETADKKKRKRKKGKSDVRCGRGLARPRDPVRPDDRPYLMVVGDAEFTTSPFCTKVITTVRVLTLENLPGPYRSYNMFPSRIRLVILQQFLQRYSWGPKEDIGRCLDVFEKIAAEAYMRELNETRQQLTKKYGNEKEKWKDFPPKWCKNIEAWKGLCDVWSTKNWDQQSATNRSNRISKEDEVHHVTGSKSMFRHKQALIKEKGESVGLKDVFDKTHMRNTPEGKVYLTRRAKEAAERFDALKGKYGDQMEEDQIWEKAVKGEDSRGRLFGFGFRGRTSKSTRVLETVEASPSGPTRSTATSAADANRSFSNVEVAQLLAAERTQFANEIAAQDRRHRAEMDALHKHHEYTRACFDALFRAGGVRPPPEPSSEANADGGHNGSGGHPNPAEGNSGGGDINEPPRPTKGGEVQGS
ncbi:Keratin-associated protein 16-1 [Carex littledalei]|uniref:Keratin-associated protein 16-1 n=1 Tax=Carex littledalei TaxID=544730 RepID=A0A833R3H3_9POAL|nr:Keratin-associated protein 16-1 [Carex littledalei]